MNAHDKKIHVENVERINLERSRLAEKLGLKPKPPEDIDGAFVKLLERESANGPR